MKSRLKVYQNVLGEHPDRHFNFTRMEYIYDRSNGETNEPHRHNYYTILWVHEANGHHQIDFKEYSFEPNQVYFVGPGQVHQVHTKGRPKGVVITFSKDFLVFANISPNFIQNINLFQPYGENPPLLLDDRSYKKLSFITGEIEDCHENQLKFYHEAVGALMKLFFIYCNQICLIADEKSENHQRIGLIRAFKDEVELKFTDWHKVKDYAYQLNITPKYLNEVVKTSVGSTAKEYIQQRIIIEAKRLLLHSPYSIKEIAYHLGFMEPIHFSSFFKQCTGYSPSSFKETYSQIQ